MLKNYLDFFLVITEKEIKARYKSALLGFLWIFLNPLLQMVIIGLVFQNFIKLPVENYFLFLFTGLLPWNFFSYSLTKATPSIVYERRLIQKAKFPREAIPVSIVLANFFNLLVSIGLLVVFLLFFGGLPIINQPFLLLSLVFSLIWLLLFTCGIALLTSALNVKYRDVKFFIEAVVLLWFYATPIVYSLEMLPNSVQVFFGANPVVYPFALLRQSLIGGSLPTSDVFLANTAISILVIGLGIIIFKKESKFFSDWL